MNRHPPATEAAWGRFPEWIGLHCGRRRWGRGSNLLAFLALLLGAGGARIWAWQADGLGLPPVVPLVYPAVVAKTKTGLVESSGNQQHFPAGTLELGGVAFQIQAPLALASRGSQSEGFDLDDKVTIPCPPGSYQGVHFLGATTWEARMQERVANLVWSYADGSTDFSAIRYVTDLRRLRHAGYDQPAAPGARSAKAAWVSHDAELDARGEGLRLYRVTFANPHPERPLKAVGFESARGLASLLVLAVSLDPAPAGSRPDPTPPLERFPSSAPALRTVTVRDATTGKPIPQAEVYGVVFGHDGRRRIAYQRQLFTDAEGRAELDVPERGVEVVGFTAKAADWGGETITWKPAPDDASPPNLVFELRRPVRLGGKVLDEAGEPIAGAEVEVWMWAEVSLLIDKGGKPDFSQATVVTGADGYWEAGGIPGNYLDQMGLRIRHDSYRGQDYSPIATEPGLEAALRAKRHEIRLARGAGVKGVVLDPSGQPVPGAKVLVTPEQLSANSARQTVADDAGAFGVSGLENGNWKVLAAAPGFVFGTNTFSVEAKASEVRVVLRRAHRLRMVVHNEAGAPVAGVRISMYPAFGNRPPQALGEAWEATTDELGSAECAVSPEHGLILDFRKAGFTDQTERVSSEAEDEVQVVVLQPEIVIEGQALDADSGQPVASFRVMQGTDASWNRSIQTVEQPEGRFRFVVKSDREDPLRVASPDHEPWELDLAELTPGSNRVVARLKRVAGLDGVVVDAAGEPVEGVSLALAGDSLGITVRSGQPQSDNSALATSDAEGRFHLQPMANPVRVLAYHPRGVANVTCEEFRKSPRIVLTTFGRVSVLYQGHVDASGSADLQLLGTVVPLQEGFSGDCYAMEGRVDAGARRTFDGVIPGEYQLGFRNLIRSHIVVEPGKTTEVVIQRQGPRIQGRLPAEWVRKQDIQWRGTVFATVNPAAIGGRTLSFAPDGTFEAEDLPAGTYQLKVAGTRSPTLAELEELKASGRANAGSSFMRLPAAEGRIEFTMPAGIPNEGTFEVGEVPVVPVAGKGK